MYYDLVESHTRRRYYARFISLFNELSYIIFSLYLEKERKDRDRSVIGRDISSLSPYYGQEQSLQVLLLEELSQYLRTINN